VKVGYIRRPKQEFPISRFSNSNVDVEVREMAPSLTAFIIFCFAVDLSIAERIQNVLPSAQKSSEDHELLLLATARGCMSPTEGLQQPDELGNGSIVMVYFDRDSRKYALDRYVVLKFDTSSWLAK